VDGTRRCTRRSFVSAIMGTAASLAATFYNNRESRAAEKTPKIKGYRVLGRTGLKVSDIGCGTYGIGQGEVLHYAREAGVNYFDTGPSYSNGNAEFWIGEVVKKSKREELRIATRWYITPDCTRDDLLRSLDGSLKRLQTDYVDLIMVGGAESVSQLTHPALHEAYEAAKKAGKVRFLGVAGHGKEMVKIMNHAVDSGKFDIIMPAYNFVQHAGLDEVIKKAKSKNIGVVAMKTMAGLKREGMKMLDFVRKRGGSIGQTAIAWALSNPAVCCAVITMKNVEMVNDYLKASGTTKLTWLDSLRLRMNLKLAGHNYCRPGCNECVRDYSGSVPVQDILRFRMYYEKYGLRETAMREYASLSAEEKVPALLAGDGAARLRRCPYGIDVLKCLVEAHQMLSGRVDSVTV